MTVKDLIRAVGIVVVSVLVSLIVVLMVFGTMIDHGKLCHASGGKIRCAYLLEFDGKGPTK